MFGRATIMLGIGPHSSCSFFLGRLGLVGLRMRIMVGVSFMISYRIVVELPTAG